ncbi:MAG: trypsin-like peptidase domain-containing protein [Acidobacteriota bacterium]
MSHLIQHRIQPWHALSFQGALIRRTARLRRFSSLLLMLVLSAPQAFGDDAVHTSDAAHDAFRSELRRVIAEARDSVFPALVSIGVVTVQYSGGKEFKGRSVGSGTIISPEGYVVTNQHVTSNGRKFVCTLSDKREVSARLVGEDPLTDLAVLQLDTDELEEPLPVARFGDSARLEIGDYVMAMGSPFSLSRSVSLGIVSNTERVFAGGFGSDDIEEMELEAGQRTGLFTRWIQHDAVISPGNSGGPLVNLRGEIVGVNELGGSTLSFAIPSNLAARVTDALIADGEVVRSWVGVSFKPIQRTGLEAGVLISSVVLDGPAGAAGVEAGDVLLRLDGEPVTVRFVEEVPLLLDRIASLPIGTSLEAVVQRGGEEITARIITAKLAKDLGKQRVFPIWGLTAQAITEKMAREWRLDSTAGAMVTGVRRGGSAQLAEPPIEAADIVRSIDGRPIAGLDDLIAVYEELYQPARDPEASAERPGELLFELARRGTNRLAIVSPREDDEDDPPRELPKAWIGVATQPVVPRLAEHLGLERGGFRITRVYPETEAAAAGLEVGDVILAVDDEALVVAGRQDAALLARRVRSLEIDGVTDLTVLRSGQTLEIPVRLERTRLAKDEARRHADSDFEMSVRELTFFDRDENRWDSDVRGVLIENVDPGGWAGLGGLRPNDLVLRINDEPIRGLKSFRRVLKEIKREQPSRVVIVVLRGVKTHFQYLEPEWTPTSD